MNYETRLLDIRELNNLNQTMVATKLGVSRQNYSFWETKTKFIPLKHLNDFCNIFNVPMDYVLKLTDSKDNYAFKLKKLNKKDIGHRLKVLRKDNKMTQKEIAKMLNTTQSTISAYEAGETLILTSFAYQICKNFNVSLDWLCCRKK